MTMIEGVPLPEVDDVNRGFWEGAAAGELRMQACTECGRMRFPPRPMCPHCNAVGREWRAVSGNGTVWSYVVPHPPLLPAFMPVAPYNVVVVALDEDPTLRLVGNLVARPDGPINEVNPATIEIGEPVRVVFQHAGEDVWLPRWMRAA